MERNTIWIIDDDLVSQSPMQYKIEQSKQNYDVVIFDTVERALATIKEGVKTQKNIPSIILLDLVSPGLDGWYFLTELERLKRHINDVDIYIVSEFSNTMDRKLAREYSLVMDCFVKPLNIGNVDQIFKRHQKK
ncbi:MAG: response regulator [Arenibacter latericius]|nr:response regulator [Arenibacter latericius]